ncbi:hypothetical protein A3K29_02120 [Candidatus Collierbacteria bacterium RIFOXYB2_FULL_46_14]|uniref:Uncharacterized protein n=1 Tax=Candidatus Collierbacteria bacterium GW2011_GWA2_46_26 TaxID=1618381 RepID=A0A0G1PJM1_9BACT|nr:MAG: hypothetical protein UW29_C0013G0014 [Candidatus Collierbacteria bacterium GW2011_GWC2_44_13]KKU32946.1 MAG: hypothetical protein UX47_C0007G0190 [Candidatus Collierbacteria bacterium GW2011_GWA2_46_26]OGD72922.1 MAG: hypothetical protein A3K29_02120 [Candidatus Collierbacteria bacterium RIFOXYB2_FULL_46_14]OGD75964.1 MAG: hypothetical protein A3K43_02120 [Candidatus Collierbacteria bacterium RIFOXYA2_FULL_46_20]OGD77300.1 MAG: hypothetical protein A3K39_02120 [Candidatus Collierbacteri
MTERQGEEEWPFKVEFSPNSDWSDLTYTVFFQNPLSSTDKITIQEIVSTWANIGVEKGYGGFMHSWEIGETSWTKKDTTFSFWADMGSSEPEKAIGPVFDSLANTGMVKKIKIS